MPLTPGTRLGPHEIVAPLGAGGMGEVYLATDTRLGREVAIKVLPADVAADRDRLARFEREAKAVSALNHPNIVTLYEVGANESGPYLVLEKIEGRSLREVMNDGQLAIRRILQLATQIAEGLAKAHAAGIVHRDLKPDNIMVTGDGFAKILDFGLAKLALPALESGSADATKTLVKDTASLVVLGTLGYLSPEQAAGKPADYRADQFALGALLYEMATRDRPFKRATLMESLAATISDEPAPVRSKRPDVPVPLVWLIERCLNKDPNDRYGSTSDLARELAAQRDHLSDLTRLPGDVPGRRDRVMPRGLAGWAVAAVVLASAAAGAYALGRRSVDVTPPVYRALTFRRGTITGARFAPDGQTIYYSAAYGAEASRVFVTHVDRPESRMLDLAPGFLLGVSAKNELAVLLTGQRAAYSVIGTLARVPALGGTPRSLLDDVQYADWASDGERLAVGRMDRQGVTRCESPIGTLVASPCGQPRVSPRSDHIAAIVSGKLQIRDPRGTLVAADDMPFVFGHAWSPDGREVWFTGSESGSPHDRALYALSLSGGRRLVARIAGAMSVYDVGPGGKSALISTGAGWFGVNAVDLATGRERPLDWLGRSDIVGLSLDGQSLLISETREVAPGAYLQSTDGARTVRIHRGIALGLSPEGTSALVQDRADPRRLLLVPTGAGAERDLALPRDLAPSFLSFARWSRDGRRLFMWLRPAEGAEAQSRVYVRDGERWQAVTPAGVPSPLAVSPTGELVATRDESGSVAIYAIRGGPPRRLDGERGAPVHWTANGRRLVLVAPDQFSARLYRRDLESGRVEPLRTIAPADPTGVMLVGRILVADDEQSLVYQYSRGLNDLYLVSGLK